MNLVILAPLFLAVASTFGNKIDFDQPAWKCVEKFYKNSTQNNTKACPDLVMAAVNSQYCLEQLAVNNATVLKLWSQMDQFVASCKKSFSQNPLQTKLIQDIHDCANLALPVKDDLQHVKLVRLETADRCLSRLNSAQNVCVANYRQKVQQALERMDDEIIGKIMTQAAPAFSQLFIEVYEMMEILYSLQFQGNACQMKNNSENVVKDLEDLKNAYPDLLPAKFFEATMKQIKEVGKACADACTNYKNDPLCHKRVSPFVCINKPQNKLCSKTQSSVPSLASQLSPETQCVDIAAPQTNDSVTVKLLRIMAAYKCLTNMSPKPTKLTSYEDQLKKMAENLLGQMVVSGYQENVKKQIRSFKDCHKYHEYNDTDVCGSLHVAIDSGLCLADLKFKLYRGSFLFSDTFLKTSLRSTNMPLDFLFACVTKKKIECKKDSLDCKNRVKYLYCLGNGPDYVNCPSQLSKRKNLSRPNGVSG